METEYLTIREAVQLTGKSQSTIRRLVSDLNKSNNTEALLKCPTPSGGFFYKIDKAEVLKHYKEVLKGENDQPSGGGVDSSQKEAEGSHSNKSDHSPIQTEVSHNKETPKNQGGHAGVGESSDQPSMTPKDFADFLISQIEKKDEQLAGKEKTIGQLIAKNSESLRDAQKTINNLQHQLFLSSGSKIQEEATTIQQQKPPKKKGFWKSLKENKV